MAAARTLVLGVDTDVASTAGCSASRATRPGPGERLERSPGRTHEVLSGVWLTGRRRGRRAATPASPAPRSPSASSTPATIDLYLRSGEWRDRAGAYAIQGLGSILVAGLQGDFSNVVGLPVALLLQLAPKPHGIAEKP